MKEAWPLLAKRGDFEILKAWKQVLTTSEREFHKQRVIKIVGDFVYLKIGKVGEKIKQSYGVSNSTFTNCSFNISFAGNK